MWVYVGGVAALVLWGKDEARETEVETGESGFVDSGGEMGVESVMVGLVLGIRRATGRRTSIMGSS